MMVPVSSKVKVECFPHHALLTYQEHAAFLVLYILDQILLFPCQLPLPRSFFEVLQKTAVV